MNELGLIISTVGNGNFGDESMFISYLDKFVLNKCEFEVYTPFIEPALTKYSNYVFCDPFKKLGFSKIKILLLTVYELFFCSCVKADRYLRLNRDINDYTFLTFIGAGNLNSHYFSSVFNFFILTKIFKQHHKKVYFRPQSIGPFLGIKGLITKMMVNKMIKFSDEFLVREQMSMEVCKKMRSSKFVKLQIDDAWDISYHEIADCKLKQILLENSKKLGICVRNWDNTEKFENYIIDLVQNAVKQNYNIFFIPIAYMGANRYIDNNFLRDKIIQSNYIFFINDFIDLNNVLPQNIKWIISKMDACIGLSYHFNVFSNSLRIKSVALYTDNYYYIKNNGLYRLLNNEGNVINPYYFNPEKILLKLEV